MLLTVYKSEFHCLALASLASSARVTGRDHVAQVDTKTLSTVPVVSLQKHLENMVSAVPLCALCGFSGQVDRQENLQNTEIYNMVYLLASALVYSKERFQRKQD